MKNGKSTEKNHSSKNSSIKLVVIPTANYSALVGVWSITAISISVCESVRLDISRTIWPNFMKFPAHDARNRGFSGWVAICYVCYFILLAALWQLNYWPQCFPICVQNNHSFSMQNILSVVSWYGILRDCHYGIQWMLKFSVLWNKRLVPRHQQWTSYVPGTYVYQYERHERVCCYQVC